MYWIFTFYAKLCHLIALLVFFKRKTLFYTFLAAFLPAIICTYFKPLPPLWSSSQVLAPESDHQLIDVEEEKKKDLQMLGEVYYIMLSWNWEKSCLLLLCLYIWIQVESSRVLSVLSASFPNYTSAVWDCSFSSGENGRKYVRSTLQQCGKYSIHLHMKNRKSQIVLLARNLYVDCWIYSLLSLLFQKFVWGKWNKKNCISRSWAVAQD